MNSGECDIMMLQQFINEHINEWKAEAERSNVNTSTNTYMMTCLGKPFCLRISLDLYSDKPYRLQSWADLYGAAFKAKEVELQATPVQGVFINHRDEEWYLSAYSVEGCGEDKFFVLAKEGWKYASLAEQEDSVILDNGSHLMNKFGKYEPNLCFISRLPHIMWRSTTPKEYNLSPKCSLCYVRGTYFKSKKGTNCFRLDENGPHVLLRDDWGGAFERYRGGNLPENQLYYRRASSNGGGCGYDYSVVPLGWRKVISEDDI